MKKCVVISCFDFYTTRTKGILGYYKDKGYDTTYIIADFNHFSKQKFKAEYADTIQVSVPAYQKNLSPARLYSHHVFSKKVYPLLKQLKPDVIYCMFPPNSLVRDVVKYKKATGVHLIFDCYDMWPESFPYAKFGKLLAFPFSCWRALRDDYIAAADKLICVSQASQEHWNTAFPQIKTALLRPNIEEGEIPAHKPLRSGELSLCYLGMINHITDTDLGVRLLTQLQKHCKVTLHLIGEGQNKDKFVGELERGGVTVVQHGILFDMDKKNEVFAQCDFGLSIPRKEIASAMPLKAVEYMRAGLPFVNTGVEDICKIVADENLGININIEDIDATVTRLLSLTEDNVLRMREDCIDFYRSRYVDKDALEEVLG